MGLKVYYVFLALVGAERLVELWLSKRNAARAFARGGVEQGRFWPMALVHALLFPACVLEARGFWPGFALAVVAAQALRWWAIATLGDRWNVRVIVVPGDAPVRRGPYLRVRHPNYVAVAVEMLCIPLAGGAWLSAAVFSLVNAWLLKVRIRDEERALGAAYARDFDGVPRFFPHG